MTTDQANAALRSLGADFLIGDRVRHATQEDGKPGIVIGVTVYPTHLRYEVAFGQFGNDTACLAIELERDEEPAWID